MSYERKGREEVYRLQLVREETHVGVVTSFGYWLIGYHPYV